MPPRSEEHTSELQSLRHLVCRLLLEKKKKQTITYYHSITPPSCESRHTLWQYTVSIQDAIRLRYSTLRRAVFSVFFFFFFFNDPAPPEIYPLPLPDALPI